MKYLLIVLVFISNVVLAQVSAELDKKNGLSKFKFGTSPALYKGKIIKEEAINTEDRGLGISYKVIDPSLTKIFGLNTEKIVLLFKANSLYAIIINFKCDIENSNYSLIKHNLETLFGNSTSGEFDDSNDYMQVITGKRWQGYHTQLDIMNVYRKIDRCYYVSIFYTSKDVSKRTLESQF